jgi:hypothetical protein
MDTNENSISTPLEKFTITGKIVQYIHTVKSFETFGMTFFIMDHSQSSHTFRLGGNFKAIIKQSNLIDIADLKRAKKEEEEITLTGFFRRIDLCTWLLVPDE